MKTASNALYCEEGSSFMIACDFLSENSAVFLYVSSHVVFLDGVTIQVTGNGFIFRLEMFRVHHYIQYSSL